MFRHSSGQTKCSELGRLRYLLQKHTPVVKQNGNGGKPITHKYPTVKDQEQYIHLGSRTKDQNIPTVKQSHISQTMMFIAVAGMKLFLLLWSFIHFLAKI